MRVFISWSGDLSRSLAEVTWSWLSRALHHVQPYFTPANIESGSRWFSEVASELSQSNYGLLCLTKENVESPWIMFEAGALSKHLQQGRVSPVLFDDLRHEDLRGPLGGFQAVRFSESEFLRLIESINGRCGSGKLADGVLKDVFTTWWPRLEARVTQITREYRTARPARAAPEQVLEETLLAIKSQDHDVRLALEMLEELVALNRHSKPGKVRTTELDAKALTDLAEKFLALKNAIASCAMTEDEKMKREVGSLARALKRFITLGIRDENVRRDLGSKLDWVDWDMEAGDQSWGGSG